MLPVSGAALFVASDAIVLLPRYSAISPYSRLLNPAPCAKWFLGRNMFQRPCSRAFCFKVSMMAG